VIVTEVRTNLCDIITVDFEVREDGGDERGCAAKRLGPYNVVFDENIVTVVAQHQAPLKRPH